MSDIHSSPSGVSGKHAAAGDPSTVGLPDRLLCCACALRILLTCCSRRCRRRRRWSPRATCALLLRGAAAVLHGWALIPPTAAVIRLVGALARRVPSVPAASEGQSNKTGLLGTFYTCSCLNPLRDITNETWSQRNRHQIANTV